MAKKKHVEFDKELLFGALMSGLDLNDCSQEDLDNIKNKSSDEAIDERYEELYEEQNDLDSTYDLSAMGATRKIGDLDFTCTLGNIVLLNNIESPLVSGKLEGDVSYEDIVKALYVLYLGKEALTPIMNIREKIQDLLILKPLCKDNPDMCEQVMKKWEQLTKSRDIFTEDAIEFYETNFVGQDLQEVFDKMFSMINDVIKGISEINIEKKNDGPRSKKNL